MFEESDICYNIYSVIREEYHTVKEMEEDFRKDREYIDKQKCVECIIDTLEWILRRDQKYRSDVSISNLYLMSENNQWKVEKSRNKLTLWKDYKRKTYPIQNMTCEYHTVSDLVYKGNPKGTISLIRA